jgi:hypothetical protein
MYLPLVAGLLELLRTDAHAVRLMMKLSCEGLSRKVYRISKLSTNNRRAVTNRVDASGQACVLYRTVLEKPQAMLSGYSASGRIIYDFPDLIKLKR